MELVVKWERWGCNWGYGLFAALADGTVLTLPAVDTGDDGGDDGGEITDGCDLPENNFYLMDGAETHVDNSIGDVSPFIDTNIIGTINLLDLSVKYDVQKFHHISTDEVYGALGYDDPPFTETTPYDPQNPYAASKASSDHFVMTYHNTYGLPTTITNCSNNYGPRQHVEKLIPKTISNILQNKPIPVYGKGENIRDWIYVEDHCRAILDLFYGGGEGHKYNIGGECEVKNIDLVKMIIKIMGASEDLIQYVDDRPGHDLRYAIDNAKIKNTVAFKPEYSLMDGLTKTIEWYEKT